MELLSKLICGDDQDCNAEIVLTGAEWFLVFVCLAIFVSQFFPSLHSLAPVSLIGSIALVVYFTMLWTLSISKGRPEGVSYEPSKVATSEMAQIRGIINSLGIIALTFKGHNLILEIQVIDSYRITILKVQIKFCNPFPPTNFYNFSRINYVMRVRGLYNF